MEQWRAELVLVGITLIWGGTFAIVKEAVTTVSPFLFTGLRFLLALLLSAVLWRGSFHRWQVQTLRYGLVLGALLAGGFLLQTVGLLFTTASRSAFITSTTVVLVPVLQLLVQRRPIATGEWIGAVVALLGLWQLTNPQFGQWNIGDLLTGASTLFWAAYIVSLDAFTHAAAARFSISVQLAFLQFVVVAFTGLAAYGLSLFGNPALARGSLADWLSVPVVGALLYTAVLASVVAMVAQTHYQRFTTPVRATLLYALEPIFASLLSWALLGERMKLSEFIGAGLILAGIVLAQRAAGLQSPLLKSR